VDLQRRLRLIPTDLNEYFERILFTVDNFYRKETAQMFQVTLKSRDVMSLMTYWYMDQEDSFLKNLAVRPISNSVIDERLGQMCKRLNACCKGLLEVYSVNSGQGQDAFFYLKVDFLHRTVRDFLRDPDMQNMLGKWVGVDFDANIAICQALIAQVKTAPQEPVFFHLGGPMNRIVHLFFSHSHVLDDSQYPLKLETRLLDDLTAALVWHRSKVGDIRNLLSSFDSDNPGSFSMDPTYLVLREAVQNGFHRYVSRKLDERSNLPQEEQADLLCCALFPSQSRPVSAPRPPMVKLLLEKGCGCYGLNGSINNFRESAMGDNTPWTLFLESEYEIMRTGTSLEDILPIIKDMLSHGADINAECFLGAIMGGTRKAAEVVRMLILDIDARALGDLLTRRTDVQQEKPESSRRKRFISMVFKGRKIKR